VFLNQDRTRVSQQIYVLPGEELNRYYEEAERRRLQLLYLRKLSEPEKYFFHRTITELKEKHFHTPGAKYLLHNLKYKIIFVTVTVVQSFVRA
jgi:hypothetical protein